MQLSHIPLPSFTLVLTSDHRSLYGGSIPTVPDHLMETIDLRYVPSDDNSVHFEDHESSTGGVGANVDPQTIFELERPEISHGGEKRPGNVTIKQKFVLLIHKFLALKRRLTHD